MQITDLELTSNALNYAHHIPGCAWDHGRSSCDCGLKDIEKIVSDWKVEFSKK